MAKNRTVWIIVIVLAVIGILAFLFLGNNLLDPEPEFILEDPNMMEITQGTQGELNGLEIGVLFVDSTSAGLSVAEAGNVDALAQTLTLEVGERARFGDTYTVRLVDVLLRENTAVVHVLEDE